jgi:hypothetical protein
LIYNEFAPNGAQDQSTLSKKWDAPKAGNIDFLLLSMGGDRAIIKVMSAIAAADLGQAVSAPAGQNQLAPDAEACDIDA